MELTYSFLKKQHIQPHPNDLSQGSNFCSKDKQQKGHTLLNEYERKIAQTYDKGESA
jgi:hypothetical protein